MAASAQNDDGEITGINVTPLVDVMLVLLIIFMVTATYIVKQAILVQLPKAASAGQTTAKTLAIVIKKDGQTYLNGVAVDDAGLVRQVQAMPQKKADLQALISADKRALHGMVVHVLDLLKEQGISKFAIEIQKVQEPAP